MRSVQTFWRRLLRFLIVWFVDTLSLLATAALIPGITLQGTDWIQRLIAASSAAMVLGLVNFHLPAAHPALLVALRHDRRLGRRPAG